jgi:HNH endonuclease
MANELIPEKCPVVTREQAIASGLKRYFTGERCSRGHLAERLVTSRGCLQCAKENTDKWIAENPDRAKAVQSRSEQKNREARVERKRQKRVVLCLHCDKPIPPPVLKPGAIRASRLRYCSVQCRLFSKVDMTPGHGPQGDCWIYTGAKHKFGYGMINKSESKKSDITTAHDYAWEIEHGPVPEGMFVLHKCDNPPCCRIDHLFLGTHQDNMDDMMEKGRKPRGSAVPAAKLTDDQVLSIRSDKRPSVVIAAEYGISKSLVGYIRQGLRWKHLA